MESQKQDRGVKKMKRVTKIIALASIFSFILSYSSLISSLQQRLHLLSMYINLVDKKYVFLLCNGIVGFIVGNFKTLLHGNAINIIEETKEVVIKDMRVAEVKKVVALLGEKSGSKEGEEKQEKVDLLRGEEEEVTLVVEDDDEGIVVQDLAIIRINDDDDRGDDDDDDDAEISDSLLSSEDLNKKCEDFIRKVKAEIRFESRKLITF